MGDGFSNRYETHHLKFVLCVQLATSCVQYCNPTTSDFLDNFALPYFFEYAKLGQVGFWHLQPLASKFEFLLLIEILIFVVKLCTIKARRFRTLRTAFTLCLICK